MMTVHVFGTSKEKIVQFVTISCFAVMRKVSLVMNRMDYDPG